MQLPKNNKKLSEIFKNVKTPCIEDLQGEFYVDMLTGVPSLRKFNHRKFFYLENGRIIGYNICGRNLRWGKFFLEKGDYNGSDIICINYNRLENTFLTRGIIDQIRCVERDVYLGRFNIHIFGKPRFLGWFSLKK